MNEIDDVWAADLVEMQEWKNVNKGYRYILNVVDCFSKFAWSVPLKDKKGETVLDSFKYIVKISDRKPAYIWVDDMLDDLVSKYNNSYHSTIRMRPIDASKLENESEVWENLFRDDKQAKTSKKFKIGDTVRISRIKGIFEHGFLPNWTEQIYKIHEINNSTPVTYILKDLKDEIIEGGFYKEELQKTSQDVFRIEKVLRKKKINGIEHGLVKWIGYNDKFNEWLPVSKINSI